MSDKRRFFADIVFVFDREVLSNYSKLADVISERWQETLTKASEAFQPPLDLKASCRVKKIFNSVEEFGISRVASRMVLIQTTKKYCCQ